MAKSSLFLNLYQRHLVKQFDIINHLFVKNTPQIILCNLILNIYIHTLIENSSTALIIDQTLRTTLFNT